MKYGKIEEDWEEIEDIYPDYDDDDYHLDDEDDIPEEDSTYEDLEDLMGDSLTDDERDMFDY